MDTMDTLNYNITSDLSVIFNEKIRKFNPSGLVEGCIQEYTSEKHTDTV